MPKRFKQGTTNSVTCTFSVGDTKRVVYNYTKDFI